MPIPTSIATTNTTAFASPVPTATSAGPGQKPAMPHPTPNINPPPTRRRSNCVTVGIFICSPSRDTVRFRAKVKAIAPTATAPAITNASDGSQLPARSRKPSTL